ncbi:MAG: S-layer homology domain-containing protein [Desulfotomaculaceae bacterium]|nr:S-layer homology domain-containing protein [Desulfotomaculaceae bacterium]
MRVGRQAPDLSITRQEICVMLTRALKAAIPSLNTSVTDPTVFADEDAIADWAIIAVRYMNSRDIMTGVGGNTINPLGNTTREQAIALVLRTYEAFL